MVCQGEGSKDRIRLRIHHDLNWGGGHAGNQKHGALRGEEQEALSAKVFHY